MPSKYQVLDGVGKPVDAHFSIITQEDDVVIHYKSRGGSKKFGGRVNTKYQLGLKLLLEGLGRLGLQIDDILVDTRVTQKMKLSESDRRIRSDAFTYPINLRTCNDFERLRKDICKPQGAIGRTKDAVKGGNQNKQMAIKVGYGTSGCTDTNQLASLVSTLGIAEHRKPTADLSVLDKRADEIRQRGELGSEPPAGNENPEQRAAPATVSHVRDPEVKAWVLEKADGICELCQQPAPFIKNNGYPYLEVHHVQPLAGEGADTVSNAAAICPNCHRRCHYSNDSIRATEQLYEQVERLERP